jgi:hypothetical protein
MTTTLTTTTASRGECQADPLCQRTLCFQAQLEAKDGPVLVKKQVKLCAVHLGDTVQVLANWADERGLTHGQVTVVIIDPPVPGEPLALPWLRQSPPGDYVFGNVELGH